MFVFETTMFTECSVSYLDLGCSIGDWGVLSPVPICRPLAIASREGDLAPGRMVSSSEKRTRKHDVCDISLLTTIQKQVSHLFPLDSPTSSWKLAVIRSTAPIQRSCNSLGAATFPIDGKQGHGFSPLPLAASFAVQSTMAKWCGTCVLLPHACKLFRWKSDEFRQRIRCSLVRSPLFFFNLLR